MAKICILYTGGTIGMVAQPAANESEVLRPMEDPAQFLDHLAVRQDMATIAQVDFLPLMNKDSANMCPADWTAMAEAVYRRRHDGYDGFVIVHGTDTLHYSAAALAFAMGDALDFPIVFTGAQTTADVCYGDARINLLRAVKVACADFAEVVVVFGAHIFRGCRVQKIDERLFDAFNTPGSSPLGHICQEIIFDHSIRRKSQKNHVPNNSANLNTNTNTHTNINTNIPVIQNNQNNRINQNSAPRQSPQVPPAASYHPNFDSTVVQCTLLPGLKPEILLPLVDNEAVDGIILQSFGAGNVPNQGDYSLIPLLEKARERHMPILITSPFAANSTLHSPYQTGRDAINAGAIAVGNMTPAALTVKFHWVLAQINQRLAQNQLPPADKLAEISRMMNTPYVNEFSS